jgi:hypothetical protein
VKGAHSSVVIVHHGRDYEATGVDYELAQRFVETCRTRLRKARIDPEAFLFMLDNAPGRARKWHFAQNDLERLLKAAYVVADQLPKDQWSELPSAGWEGVYYNGDRIEMWELSVQRRGALWRVVEGGWTSTHLSASHFEEVTYVGARRGALLYSRY